MSDRKSVTDGLRAFADFLDAHPEIPTSALEAPMNVFVSDREALGTIARIGGWKKSYAYGDWFCLTRSFGAVELHVNTERENVCRKVVTGTRTIPAQAERVVEEYTWECDEPLLAGDR